MFPTNQDTNWIYQVLTEQPVSLPCFAYSVAEEMFNRDSPSGLVSERYLTIEEGLRRGHFELHFDNSDESLPWTCVSQYWQNTSPSERANYPNLSITPQGRLFANALLNHIGASSHELAQEDRRSSMTFAPRHDWKAYSDVMDRHRLKQAESERNSNTAISPEIAFVRYASFFDMLHEARRKLQKESLVDPTQQQRSRWLEKLSCEKEWSASIWRWSNIVMDENDRRTRTRRPRHRRNHFNPA